MGDILEVRGLSRRFEGLRAVDDLSFAVTEGEIFGIVGPNGAGKTTAINLISGTLRPTAGRTIFRGEDITAKPVHALVRRGIVRTFQATTVYARSTVLENCRRGAFLWAYAGFFPSVLHSRAATQRSVEVADWIDHLLDRLGLAQLRDAVAGSLSYGNQKTLGLAIAAATRPRLLMLDEPVAGLNAEEADRIRRSILDIRSQGTTVVTIDHNTRFMRKLCDHILVMHHGKELAVGAPDAVFANPLVIDAYLGKGYAAT